MAPPAKTPRLSAIEPDRLATETVESVAESLAQLAVPLSPWVIHVERTTPAGECDLAHSIRDLHAWAARGVGREDAFDLLTTVGAAVFGRAAIDEPIPTPAVAGDVDPVTEIGLLLLAAWARLQVTARDSEQIRAKDLAALASLSTLQVRNLIRQGEIELTDGVVTPKTARRWLKARGVTGF
jgi:hypothetical protein